MYNPQQITECLQEVRTLSGEVRKAQCLRMLQDCGRLRGIQMHAVSSVFYIIRKPIE